MAEGITLTKSDSTITIELRCSSPQAAEVMRDQIMGDISDFGKFTITVGKLGSIRPPEDYR